MAEKAAAQAAATAVEEAVALRDATLADAAAVAEIYNQSIAAGNATMDEVPKTVREIRRQIEGFGKREVILLLESGDRVLGWGVIKRYSDRPGYRFACETAVYLRRELIGKGYGSRIKKALIDRARAYGYHHLVAKIFAGNVASIKYNRKFGYQPVGIQKEIGYRNGRWVDVVILQLVLDDVPPGIPDRYR